MTFEEIINRLIDKLRAHAAGKLGHMQQEPYKGDLFRIFASAYNSGFMEKSAGSQYLSADSLRDLLVARAPDIIDNKVVYDFFDLWSEWRYAWDHANQKGN